MRLTNVSHSYNGHTALSTITWAPEKNAITSIIGRSGSGKSTLLQLFNGLVRPSFGTIEMFDQPLDYTNLPALRLKIGYMVQGTGLFPHMTVFDNIAVGGKITGSSNTTSRTKELMNLVGLPHAYTGKYPYQLSGGEQQRVGICRALFLDPPVLLMDEPLGALDPIIRKEIQDQILKLQQEKPRTVLFVTHDMREARAISDFILVLDKGVIQQYGSRDVVLVQPENELVRKLILAAS